jgi:hypothetical protein
MGLPVAADPSGTIDPSVWAQYGVLGAIAAILIWFAKGAHQRERDRADRAEEDNRRLRDLIRDRDRADRAEEESRRLYDLMIERIIPAMMSATRAAEESAELLNVLQRERELHQFMRRTEGGS